VVAMTILLPTLAFAFAAFCVWLTVRIVNWKERWAKSTLAAAVFLGLMHVVPVCAYEYGRLELTGRDTLGCSVFKASYTFSAGFPTPLRRPLRMYWIWWLRLGQSEWQKVGPSIVTGPI